jgi:hypothetical protein
METNYDGGNVKISTDGGSSWTILTPDIGYNGTARTTNAGIPGEACFTGYLNNTWQKVTFDLTPYKGQMVIARLHFGSDSSVQKVGWYVDDVRVESVYDTEGPKFASVTVPASTFNTTGPYTAKAKVLDGLSGVSSVTLYYSTDGGSSFTPVMMAPTANPSEYGGDIPGQSSGTRVKLYFAAVDNASNSSSNPADAPASTYEFGIMPSGDFLVIVGGSLHTDPLMYQQAFSAIGRTVDVWDWDDNGVLSAAVLELYDAVIIDESGPIDATQQAAVKPWLGQNDGTAQKVFFLGRDLAYYSTSRPFMEQYTGATYVKDDPGDRQLRSMPGDPIGYDETFVIAGVSPDELKLSTTYTGANIVYKYSGAGTTLDTWDSADELREFVEKSGKDWDPKMWPMAPSGPDTVAAVRFVGPYHASVFFAFNFNYIQEATRRAAILDRALTWLSSAAGGAIALNQVVENETPDLPDRLTLGQNYPNPFNPSTQIKVGVPEGVRGDVSLKIYNVRGQLVATLFEGTKAPGWYTFGWDGRNSDGGIVSTGVYFARFVNGKTALTRKMILLK